MKEPKKDPVVQSGDPVLRKVATEVPKKDFGSSKLRKLIANMKRVLKHETFGVAIAAPQVGESLRLFVIAGKAFVSESKKEIKEEDIPPDMVFINPKILRVSKKKREMSEGCLSVRGRYGTVERHEKASIKAYDESGKPFVYQGSDLIAHIFQHECDHLDGILYTDKAKKLTHEDERESLRKKYPA